MTDRKTPNERTVAARKYLTEIAFNLASQGVLILHPKDIAKIDEQSEEVQNLADDCHIYLIARRPRLAFVPSSVKVSGGFTRGKMTYRNEGQLVEIEFGVQGVPAGEIRFSPYPHNTLLVFNGEECTTSLPANLLGLTCEEINDRSIRDLEVVYVGMSIGDGTRTAKDRLRSHSTLQQVLADMSADDPDSEATLILVQYAPPYSIITFDGRDESLSIDKDRDVIADLRRQQYLIDKKTEIALAEAGLIKYFEPRYNEKYKNNFPDKAHTVTESLYDIDFLAFIVELNTQDVSVRLFSDKRKPGYHHLAQYDLHDPDERKSFFNMLESSSSYSAETLSGPVF